MTSRKRKAERRAKAHAKYKGPGVLFTTAEATVAIDLAKYAFGVPSHLLSGIAPGPPPDPVMVDGVQDAKAVFEKLTQGDVDDVSPLEFPTEDQIIAELYYSIGRFTDWRAVVVRNADHGHHPVFGLWYRQGERFQKSGSFINGQDLINFLRKEARHKFLGAQPTLDTLDSLQHKSASSVVPVCFKVAKSYEKCGSCPYVESCFEGSTIQDGQYLEDARSMPDLTEEPEEVFLHRLKGKIKNADWGD